MRLENEGNQGKLGRYLWLLAIIVMIFSFVLHLLSLRWNHLFLTHDMVPANGIDNDISL